MGTEQNVRKGIIAACIKMNEIGINQGTSGNVSCRWKKGMLITPSGIPYEQLITKDIIYVKFRDNSTEGPHKPSSEWRFHRDILAQRKDVDAVVHTHSNYATAMAIRQLDIPAIHYMIAAAGGKKITCAEYATFGTQKLSDNALAALKNRLACLLAHHGVIALGASVEKALWLAIEVETLAKQYSIANQYGEIKIIPDKEMKKVINAFKTYGPEKKS
ncbi:MAG: class II aldolase/adducin family protein [Desulfofustis sp.]|nr:class II aldolase/adducin family protein [Bacteroidia bacterium]MBT8355005.1 class II aldolase/adducin family protein [Desulfofustis sp.]